MAARRELLAIVTFSPHFRQSLLRRRFTVVTDRRALQLLHNFKGPYGITARRREKIALFDYELKQRQRMSIGDANGLSGIPPSMDAVDESFPEPNPQYCSDIHAPNNSLE